jgi:hypothetical protein
MTRYNDTYDLLNDNGAFQDSKTGYTDTLSALRKLKPLIMPTAEDITMQVAATNVMLQKENAEKDQMIIALQRQVMSEQQRNNTLIIANATFASKGALFTQDGVEKLKMEIDALRIANATLLALSPADRVMDQIVELQNEVTDWKHKFVEASNALGTADVEVKRLQEYSNKLYDELHPVETEETRRAAYMNTKENFIKNSVHPELTLTGKYPLINENLIGAESDIYETMNKEYQTGVILPVSKVAEALELTLTAEREVKSQPPEENLSSVFPFILGIGALLGGSLSVLFPKAEPIRVATDITEEPVEAAIDDAEEMVAQ